MEGSSAEGEAEKRRANKEGSSELVVDTTDEPSGVCGVVDLANPPSPLAPQVAKLLQAKPRSRESALHFFVHPCGDCHPRHRKEASNHNHRIHHHTYNPGPIWFTS